ncbi:succinate dehydrogenase assembly factor 2 [Litoribacillus peritrichatus]|uniref:FAD assembly factor SdhE n=1 Tax=Litoribacillus peritrichatus TaxID=718191 RepID=A0ABP7MXW5_9GAMM
MKYTDQELNRIYWHSRRGMLELDVLLMPFAKEIFPTLDDDNQLRYIKLLECEDQDMFQWFMQKSRPQDTEIAAIVDYILERVQPG